TVSYSVALMATVQAYAAAYRSFGSGTSGFSFGLSMPLGARISSSAGYTRDRQGTALQWQANQPDFVAGDAGWRVQREQALAGDGPSRRAAEVAYRGELARFSAALESVRESTAARVGVQGSLLAMGGALRAGLPVNESLAV